MGQHAPFHVEARGQEPLRFQWSRNGRPIAGADGPTHTVFVTAADDGAEYRCQVSNGTGAMKSQAALWTTPLPKQAGRAPGRPESPGFAPITALGNRPFLVPR